MSAVSMILLSAMLLVGSALAQVPRYRAASNSVRRANTPQRHVVRNTVPRGAAWRGARGLSGWAYDPDTPRETIAIAISIGGTMESPNTFGESIRANRNPRMRRLSQTFSYTLTAERIRTITQAMGRSGTFPAYVYALDTRSGHNRLLNPSPIQLEIVDPDNWRSPTYEGARPKVICHVSRLGMTRCVNGQKWLADAERAGMIDMATLALDRIRDHYGLGGDHDTYIDCGGAWASIDTDPMDTLHSGDFATANGAGDAQDSLDTIETALGERGEDGSLTLPGEGMIPAFNDACLTQGGSPLNSNGSPGGDNGAPSNGGNGDATDSASLFDAHLDALCASAGGPENLVAVAPAWLAPAVVIAIIEVGYLVGSDLYDRYNAWAYNGVQIRSPQTNRPSDSEADGTIMTDVSVYQGRVALNNGTAISYQYGTATEVSEDGENERTTVTEFCEADGRECTEKELEAARKIACANDPNLSFCSSPPPPPTASNEGDNTEDNADDGSEADTDTALAGDCGEGNECAATCDELRAWWAFFSQDCEESDWNAYECQRWSTSMNLCGAVDPGLVYPNPVDDNFACTTIEDQNIRNRACELMGGAIQCFDGACDCIMGNQAQRPDVAPQMENPCDSPYAYCTGDEPIHVPGGVQPPSPFDPSDPPNPDTPDGGGGGSGGTPGL
jgi:hypothetical protein